jgi:hypothetical protein
MVKKPWHVERVSDDSYYVQDANGVKLACILQASFPRRGAKRFSATRIVPVINSDPRGS